MKPARNVTRRYTRHNKMRRKGTLSYTKCMCITVTMLAMASHVFLCDSFLFFQGFARSFFAGWLLRAVLCLIATQSLSKTIRYKEAYKFGMFLGKFIFLNE